MNRDLEALLLALDALLQAGPDDADLTDEFDELIEAGKKSSHRLLTRKVLTEIWKRGRSPIAHGRIPGTLRF
jgi:hypothetical protein